MAGVILSAIFAICAAVLIMFNSLLPHKGWEKNGSELTALATALFWEGAIAEPKEGLRAIAHVIFNRVRSRSFPDTIREVVVQGVRPGKRDSCQFSFACDGEVEDPRVLCRIHHLSDSVCNARWRRYLFLAAWWLYISPGEDPTDGAVLYYTGRKPYWVADLVEGSTRKIGSHTFGRSKWVGTDLARQEE